MRLGLRLSETNQILLGLYGPTIIMSLGQGMAVPTIPALASTFDVSAGLAAQVVTARMLGAVVALLPVGIILDRFGRKPVLVGGPLLVATASALTAVAPLFILLLIAQFLTGLGTSAWSMARELAAVDVVRQDQRGRMMSGFHGMHSVGTAIGPVFGGVITDAFGFQAVFWVYSLLSLITLWVSIRIRETARPRARERGPLLTIGRLSQVEPYYRTTFVVITFNTFVAMMRGALIASLVPLYVGLELGHSSTAIGTLFGIYGVVNVLMIAPTGVLSDKLGRKAVVVPSTFLATLVFIAFPLVTGMAGLSVLLVLTGIATGLALGTMATYTYDVIPEHARARLQTLRRLFGEMGGISGPILGGLISDAASPGAAFWAFVPLQLSSGLAITFFARESLYRERERERTTGANV
jgi:MFS family permease